MSLIVPVETITEATSCCREQLPAAARQNLEPMYTVKLDKDYTKTTCRQKHSRELRGRLLLGLGGVAYPGCRRIKARLNQYQVTVCVCGMVMRLCQSQLKQAGLLHLHLRVNMRHLHGEARVSRVHAGAGKTKTNKPSRRKALI